MAKISQTINFDDLTTLFNLYLEDSKSDDEGRSRSFLDFLLQNNILTSSDGKNQYDHDIIESIKKSTYSVNKGDFKRTATPTAPQRDKTKSAVDKELQKAYKDKNTSYKSNLIDAIVSRRENMNVSPANRVAGNDTLDAKYNSYIDFLIDHKGDIEQNHPGDVRAKIDEIAQVYRTAGRSLNLTETQANDLQEEFTNIDSAEPRLKKANMATFWTKKVLAPAGIAALGVLGVGTAIALGALVIPAGFSLGSIALGSSSAALTIEAIAGTTAAATAGAVGLYQSIKNLPTRFWYNNIYGRNKTFGQLRKLEKGNELTGQITDEQMKELGISKLMDVFNDSTKTNLGDHIKTNRNRLHEVANFRRKLAKKIKKGKLDADTYQPLLDKIDTFFTDVLVRDRAQAAGNQKFLYADIIAKNDVIINNGSTKRFNKKLLREALNKRINARHESLFGTTASKDATTPESAKRSGYDDYTRLNGDDGLSDTVMGTEKYTVAPHIEEPKEKTGDASKGTEQPDIQTTTPATPLPQPTKTPETPDEVNHEEEVTTPEQADKNFQSAYRQYHDVSGGELDYEAFVEEMKKRGVTPSDDVSDYYIKALELRDAEKKAAKEMKAKLQKTHKDNLESAFVRYKMSGSNFTENNGDFEKAITNILGGKTDKASYFKAADTLVENEKQEKNNVLYVSYLANGGRKDQESAMNDIIKLANERKTSQKVAAAVLGKTEAKIRAEKEDEYQNAAIKENLESAYLYYKNRGGLRKSDDKKEKVKDDILKILNSNGSKDTYAYDYIKFNKAADTLIKAEKQKLEQRKQEKAKMLKDAEEQKKIQEKVSMDAYKIYLSSTGPRTAKKDKKSVINDIISYSEELKTSINVAAQLLAEKEINELKKTHKDNLDGAFVRYQSLSGSNFTENNGDFENAITEILGGKTDKASYLKAADTLVENEKQAEKKRLEEEKKEKDYEEKQARLWEEQLNEAYAQYQQADGTIEDEEKAKTAIKKIAEKAGISYKFAVNELIKAEKQKAEEEKIKQKEDDLKEAFEVAWKAYDKFYNEHDNKLSKDNFKKKYENWNEKKQVTGEEKAVQFVALLIVDDAYKIYKDNSGELGKYAFAQKLNINSIKTRQHLEKVIKNILDAEKNQQKTQETPVQEVKKSETVEAEVKVAENAAKKTTPDTDKEETKVSLLVKSLETNGDGNVVVKVEKEQPAEKEEQSAEQLEIDVDKNLKGNTGNVTPEPVAEQTAEETDKQPEISQTEVDEEDEKAKMEYAYNLYKNNGGTKYKKTTLWNNYIKYSATFNISIEEYINQIVEEEKSVAPTRSARTMNLLQKCTLIRKQHDNRQIDSILISDLGINIDALLQYIDAILLADGADVNTTNHPELRGKLKKAKEDLSTLVDYFIDETQKQVQEAQNQR